MRTRKRHRHLLASQQSFSDDESNYYNQDDHSNGQVANMVELTYRQDSCWQHHVVSANKSVGLKRNKQYEQESFLLLKWNLRNLDNHHIPSYLHNKRRNHPNSTRELVKRNVSLVMKRPATIGAKKLAQLPEIFVTTLYLICMLIILNAITSHRFGCSPIQLVGGERLSRNFQQQPMYPLPVAYPQSTPPPPQPPRQAEIQTLSPRLNLPDIIAQQGGIIKDKNITLTKQFNPIILTKDIVIRRNAKLTIESGTELLFDKSRGIIVHGILEILGNANDRVKLNLLKTHQSPTINFRSQSSNNQQVRLVDGDLPSEGRVQIKFNDRWHSLCTNSKNLTAADIKVLCHQAGYQEGNWYKWFPKRNETTHQIMSKSFHCVGNEPAITQCKRWNRLRAGGGVCDFHSDLGIRCSRKLTFGTSSDSGVSYDYWRGIEFINSETSQEYVLDGQMRQKVSKSRLSHVTISDSGLNEVGNATAAIRALGLPPRLNDIEIKNSIYGIMIEEADDAIGMSNIRLVNNMGNPLFINTSWGKVVLDQMHVENNGGDGIRVARHEKIIVGSHDFCKFANLGTSQSYPVVLSHEQQFLTSGRECCQEFISTNQLTVHFPVLRSTHNNLLPEGDVNRRITVPSGINIGNDANLVIYDDYREEFPFKLRIQNGTRAQSIVSKSGRLKICYEPASYRTVLFTLEVVANQDEEEWTGIAHDVEVRNSFIRRNEGRGIWINNQRSGVKLINTTVLQHNYLSGVHVENGTGEVILRGCQVSNNTGHGLYINLAGGYYHIDNSTITDNTLKGILIEYDRRRELVPFNHTMHMGYSLIARNGENGLFIGNVCRSDAFWNVSMNSFIRNGEDAIVFHSCLPSTSEMLLNFSNATSRLNLSGALTDNMSADQTPIKPNPHHLQDVFFTHNVFVANARRAITMAPVFFVKTFIRHNLFRDHPLAVLHINNQAFGELLSNSSLAAPANIRIASNRFYSNRGRYVANIGLQEDNQRQALVFTKNYLIGNAISEPYADLKPRSRVSAVVVVSSSNTKVVRNSFENPQSNFELGAHLEAHSKIINATANFWGQGLDAVPIYRRIFDRKNRYNLAQVEFLQYLMSPEDLEYITDLSFDRERDKITTYKNGTILGGEVKGYEELPPDTYIVQDDIFVRPGGHLILKPGTVLKFHDGVGVMVQGRLDVLGRANSQVVLTSAVAANRVPPHGGAIMTTTTTTPVPFAHAWVSHLQDSTQHGEDDNKDETMVSYGGRSNSTSWARSQGNRRILGKRQASYHAGTSSVRLSHTTMGRLEVQIDGVWGSVCDYNFDINDAAVACQQLGMILNRDDWLLERFQYAANDQQQLSMMSSDALMTNLRCDPALDTDITACKAEISLRGEFDGLCNSEVGIRCFPPSWSGLRLGMGAEVSTLEHVTIQRAGMFDYASYSLKPALQIDFNRHLLSSLVVKSNSDSGLGIMWNDVIGRHFTELYVADSKFLNNERHGIELRSRGLTIKSCMMANNRQNGLDYNPTLSQKELADLLSWLPTAKNSDNIISLAFPLRQNYFSVPSSENAYRFFIIERSPRAEIMETFTIGTDPGHMLSVHLLNPIHPDSSEVLNMSIGLNPESPIWDFRVNMTSFPMISPGYKFHFNYTSGPNPSGNIVLYIRSRYNNRDLKVLTKFIPAHLIMPRFDQTATNINAKLINSLVITNSTISKNGIGLKFRYPNHAYGPQAAYNRRYANETTNVTGNTFDGNYFSAMLVSSDEYELGFDASNKLLTSPSEIFYYVFGNKIRRNKDGIRQFSRDIRYSYNVFHWSINDTTFDYNRGGGINLMLPYYWRYDTNLSHTLDISNNNFSRNVNFELTIEGHFVKFNLTRNIFRENRCRTKLIGLAGMEKRMLVRGNIIEYNTCNRLIDFNIQSHADKMGHVPAHFEFNSIRFNKRSISNSTYWNLASQFKYPRLLTKLHPQATDYTLQLKGVQSLNITRNLFSNPELRYELVIAIVMDPDERTVNAIENYWGSVIVSEINERIFDFDDWNSYALAELSPFLIQDSFSAATMIAVASSGGPSGVHETINDQSIFGLSRSPLTTSSNIKPTLGGRLMKSMVLPYRREPYIVESDLTIMPNIRLTIEKGATLEFMPNVGVLVLGELIAAGTRDRPIQMRPVLGEADVLPLRQYLFPTKTRPNMTQTSLSDPLSYEHNYAFKHYHFAYPVDMGSIRLCKNEICHDGTHIYENNVEEQNLRREVLQSAKNTWKMDGFLEIFNMTTLQWAPVCDPLFTEHTARVACRQLGYSHLSLYKRGKRYTIEQEQITSVRHWPESVQCDGDESALSSCHLTATGFMNHSTVCTRESNQFVYVYCSDLPENGASSGVAHGATGEHLHHWGGIRFSCPSLGLSSSTAGDIDADSRTISSVDGFGPTRSRLQYVSVDRAGILHRKKAPAIQVLQCNVLIEYVAVTNSAHHGIEMITSQGNQNFHQLRVKNNLGVGLNYLSLTGSSSASKLVPYLPLKHLDISSDIFGLVDVCGANKEIRIGERLLLFYRYNSRPVDCVKIITSKMPVKHLGIRMLQFDLFNSTSFTPKSDYIKVYDGSVFDSRDSRLLVELGTTERHRMERPELKFYQTSDSTMSVRLHASGSSGLFGFIAEVVTTPVSYNIQRDTYNNMTFCEFANNKLGALSVASAGESSPNMIIKSNRFEANCLHLFGNFTSCVAPIYMELQNCQRLKLINNLIKSNQAGGVMIKSYSHTAVSALDAALENNVFESNSNTNTLALLGPKTDPYQMVRVVRNFFTRNVAPYLSNVVLSRIVANFSGNIVSGNIGRHQIEVVGFDKLPLSYQTFSNNWIYNNTATFERDQSTIFGNSAGQQYYMNYFVNPDNHFEISTMNWSRYDVRPLQVPRDDEIIHLTSGDGSTKDVFRKTADAIPLNIIDTRKVDLYQASINARHNWWGFNTTSAIQGRIRDRLQHEELIKVDFVPFLETNHTVLSGICAGGWQRVGDACLFYVGTRMAYLEARDFCDHERATLPLLRGNHYEFTDFVREQEHDFDSKFDRIWVRSFDVSREACPALNDYRTKNYDCNDKYAFICEKDPQVVVSLLYWHRETGGLVAIILFLITLVLTLCCSVCWGYKSQQRHKEKMIRKNSLRASKRSLARGAATYSSSNSLSELFLHRQIYNTEKSSSITDLSLSTQFSQPTSQNNNFNNDQSHLVRLDPDPFSSQRSSSVSATGAIKIASPRTRQKKVTSPKMPLGGNQLETQHVVSVMPSYTPPTDGLYYAHQLAVNPDYVSPTPPAPPPPLPPQVQHETTYKSQVSPPPYREDNLRAPRSHSRSPSYTGSFTGDVNTNPMPILVPSHNTSQNLILRSGARLRGSLEKTPTPVPSDHNHSAHESVAPPPVLSYEYSNINLINNTNGRGVSMNPDGSSGGENYLRARKQTVDGSGGSSSSVPTYYSNQIDTYEESTQSYLESYNIYNEAYHSALANMNNDQVSYVITERSSITDLIVNSSQHTQGSTIDSQADLISIMKPHGSAGSDFQLNNNGTHDGHHQPSLADRYRHQGGGASNRAFSESGSRSNRYCMETSFDDFEAPRLNQSASLGGSQRLSPDSSNYLQNDSKLGSRVYLETSFE